jgi:hypothetical protein
MREAAKAEYLVTGAGRHLLNLSRHKGSRIISARQVARILGDFGSLQNNQFPGGRTWGCSNTVTVCASPLWRAAAGDLLELEFTRRRFVFERFFTPNLPTQKTKLKPAASLCWRSGPLGRLDSL